MRTAQRAVSVPQECQGPAGRRSQCSPSAPVALGCAQGKPTTSHRWQSTTSHAERTCLCPQGRRLSASVTAQSSTTHSRDTDQSSSVTPSPQSGHGCQSPSPELSTFKHDCTGPFPSTPEARCSRCSEEPGHQRGGVACPKLHIHSCSPPLDKSTLSICHHQTPC